MFGLQKLMGAGFGFGVCPQFVNRRDSPRQATYFLSMRPQKVSKKGLSPGGGHFGCELDQFLVSDTDY